MDVACLWRRLNEYPVDPTLNRQVILSDIVIRQVLLVGRVEQLRVLLLVISQIVLIVAGGQAANPPHFAVHFEVNHAVVRRASASLFVEHLHLDESHVGTVSLEALWILDGSEPQLIGFTSSLNGTTTGFHPVGIGHRLELSCLERHVFKRVKPVEAALALTLRLAIDKEFHLVAC